jgi:hypothetical protein
MFSGVSRSFGNLPNCFFHKYFQWSFPRAIANVLHSFVQYLIAAVGLKGIDCLAIVVESFRRIVKVMKMRFK